MLNKLFAAAFAAFALIASPAMAQSAMSNDGMSMPAMGEPIMLGDLELTNAFTRAMPPNAPAGGGFVTITNHGTTDDRLVSASSNVGGVVEIHEMKIVDDVMKMQSLPDGLVIPAGQTVELKPGGYHIMFINVDKPFAEGEMVPVTLTFENAGSVDLMLPVAPLGAMAMPGMNMNHG
ncbi:MAG: copper chaperone PCu(A)C [Hyphomicrobiaceae bacterium]|nr:copper chaperone PCu(A)C [Hyphomicrobiaceae bacterium]MCC0024321.1 copper chaperone PCu(A)C [Hyphomicrobiaceae bacterium]